MVPYEEEGEKKETFIPGVDNQRMNFIRKVYGILSVQLAVTFGGVAYFGYQQESRMWL